jgi:TPP-dependent pyruvate/acetoin dehydrogenase alpha subunit
VISPAAPVRSELPAARASLSGLAAGDLELLLLIRHFELAVLELFARGELHGTTHTCLGQEHVPVALRTLLSERDFVLSNHRGHGHYLARFDDPHGLLAELMGREGGVCNGVGGSQHLLRGRFLSTGVQGESLPVAAGLALHLKRGAGQGDLACVHVGDGTWGEGAVYEALNLAKLWGLPLLVVVEHNGIAQSTPTELQMAGTVAGRARAFGVRHHHSASLDVNELRAEWAPLVARVRAERQPVVLEVAVQRLGPHSKGDDTRPPEVLALARERDWYRWYEAGHPEQFRAADERARARVAEVVQEVSARPPATWEGP